MKCEDTSDSPCAGWRPAVRHDLSGDRMEPADSPRGRRILIIDDDPHQRETLQRLVEARGAHAVVATDGFEGFRQLERSHPDAVLCDLAMPIMDGIEFATRMRREHRYRRVPLIAVTGRV